jgi:Mannosyl-glycoprotein endo-beta-N-acetylglucosaminidase
MLMVDMVGDGGNYDGVGGPEEPQCVNEPFNRFFARNGYPASFVASNRKTDPTILLGLSAYESGWGRSRAATRRHNPFGATPKGDATAGLSFSSNFEAWKWWDSHYGPRIDGSGSNVDAFLDSLLVDNKGSTTAVDRRGSYNSENPKWKGDVKDVIQDVRDRWGDWLVSGC